jgi:hypothetical protein
VGEWATMVTNFPHDLVLAGKAGADSSGVHFHFLSLPINIRSER